MITPIVQLALAMLIIVCEIFAVGFTSSYSWNLLVVPATHLPLISWKAFSGLMLIYTVTFKCIPPDTDESVAEIFTNIVKKFMYLGVWTIAIYLLGTLT